MNVAVEIESTAWTPLSDRPGFQLVIFSVDFGILLQPLDTHRQFSGRFPLAPCFAEPSSGYLSSIASDPASG